MEPDGAKILVVDDIPGERAAPRGGARSARIPGVSRPCRVRRRCKLVEEHDPDLVLLDVVMPGMDGYAVCRSIRANDGDRAPARDHGHVEHRAGEDRGDRGGRRRLHPQAVQPRRAADARPLASAHQALPGRDQGAEPDARAARPEPGRRARAPGGRAARLTRAHRGRRRRRAAPDRARPARRRAAVSRRARREPARGRGSDRVGPGQGEGDPGRAVRDDRPGDAGVP